MESEQLNYSKDIKDKISNNKKKFTNKFTKILIFIKINYITLIIIILIIYIFYLKLKLNKYIKKFKNNDQKKEIKFIKSMFQLYIENRTEYYIKGRQRKMEINGKKYNESNIITIQDKLNWLIIHESPESKTNIVDKILLHNYSRKILGKDICVPILKIYNNVNEINLDELPDRFVLKCNHGSKFNILCNNKSNFNITIAKKKLKKWMKINYGLENYEYQYINVKKKIFAEKFLCDGIINYKINCYNGQPKFIRVTKDLPDKSAKIHNYYDLNWNLNDLETNKKNYIRKPEIIFEKPKYLNLMLEYAKKFASNFIFIRVDFYEINNQIYLSELTFSPFNILMNYKNLNQSIYLGNQLNITMLKKKKIHKIKYKI